jgi:hypothetical protein
MLPSDTDADDISIHVSVVDNILTGMEGTILTDERHKQITWGEDNFRQRHPLLEEMRVIQRDMLTGHILVLLQS